MGHLTQRDLASMLGVGHSRLAAYIEERELPRINVIMRLANIGGITVDELLKGEKDPQVEEGKYSGVRIGGAVSRSIVAGRDVRVGKMTRQYRYEPKKGDLTPEQAQRLKELVTNIVETEKAVKLRPAGYGGVWNALNRRMKVTYYREIPTEKFPIAEAYLQQWLGRVKRSLRRFDPDIQVRERYKAIFARAKRLGLKKAQVDDLILGRFGKPSIRDLTEPELEQLYNSIMASSRRPPKR